MKAELLEEIVVKVRSGTKKPGVYSHKGNTFGFDGKNLFVYDWSYRGIFEYAFGFLSKVCDCDRDDAKAKLKEIISKKS